MFSGLFIKSYFVHIGLIAEAFYIFVIHCYVKSTRSHTYQLRYNYLCDGDVLYFFFIFFCLLCILRDVSNCLDSIRRVIVLKPYDFATAWHTKEAHFRFNCKSQAFIGFHEKWRLEFTQRCHMAASQFSMFRVVWRFFLVTYLNCDVLPYGHAEQIQTNLRPQFS